MTLPPADQPAAPGVTKEVEDAICALQDATADEAYLESSDLAQSSAKIRAAYAGLLAAIEKEVNHDGYCNLHGRHLGYACPECPYEDRIAQLEQELSASRAENATLQAELAMATDAANKGDDARTKAGAMQDQISDLRNIIAGMFWAGGSIDDKTVGDIRALGLDCRAENAALAKLADELSVDHRDDDTFDAGVRYALFILGFEKEAVEANDASKALRAGQQKGEPCAPCEDHECAVHPLPAAPNEAGKP